MPGLRFFRLMSLVMVVIFLGGCSLSFGGSGGGSGSSGGSPSPEEIKQAVREELRTPEMQTFIAEQVRSIQSQQLLGSPEGKKELEKQVMTTLDTPEVKKNMEDVLGKLMDSPDTKKKIQDAVRSALMQMLSGGGGGGGSTSGGGGGGTSGGG